MSYHNQQDEFLKKNLQSLRAEPDADLWTNISAKLDTIPLPTPENSNETKNEIIKSTKIASGGRSYLRWFVAASIAFVLVSSVFILNKESSEKGNVEVLAQSETSLSRSNSGISSNIIPSEKNNIIADAVAKSNNNPIRQSNNESTDSKVLENNEKDNTVGLLTSEIKPKPFKGVILNMYNVNNATVPTINRRFTTVTSGISTIREDEQALADASQLYDESGKVNSASYFYQVGLKLFWQGNYCKSHLHLSKAKGLLCNRDKIHDEVDEVIRLVENKINEDCICMVDEDPFIQN